MMKAGLLVLLYLFYSVECRKVYVPIDKNANVAFINMEAGGVARPPPSQGPAAPASSPVKPSSPTNVKPPSSPSVVKPASPVTPPPPKPVITVVAPTPPKPNVPAKPVSPVKPSPVQPGSPTLITTPGPGTVKQLVNFYDSQGKASPIRPYSYSQAVKQG